MTSIDMDWSKLDYDRWENCGRNVLSEILENPEHKDFKRVAKELDVLEDGKLVDYYEEQIDSYSDPMMSFGHILEITPKDEDILKVVLETCCSVMYDNENNKYYIVLCGGGMDLSQDIALAYVWLEKWIPKDLINSVCKQRGLSKGGKQFDELREAIVEQSKHYANTFNQLGKDWKDK